MENRTRRSRRTARAAGRGSVIALVNDDQRRVLERAFDTDNPYDGFAEEGEPEADESAAAAVLEQSLRGTTAMSPDFLAYLEHKYCDPNLEFSEYDSF